MIVVAARETRPWWRWLVAHALGHSVMHAGNQVWLAGRSPLLVGRQEWQADCFAGWLLFGDGWPRVPVWELAEFGGVPAECVARWLDVAGPSGWGTIPGPPGHAPGAPRRDGSLDSPC